MNMDEKQCCNGVCHCPPKKDKQVCKCGGLTGCHTEVCKDPEYKDIRVGQTWVCKDGTTLVRIICTDRKGLRDWSVIGLMTFTDCQERVSQYTSLGKFSTGDRRSVYDLDKEYIAPKKMTKRAYLLRTWSPTPNLHNVRLTFDHNLGHDEVLGYKDVTIQAGDKG